MPVLKHEKIDDIEDVTIVVMNDIAMRHGKFHDNVHVCLAEEEKTKDDVMINMSEGSDLCWSSQTSHIDVLIDFPSAKSMDRFIEILQEIREQYYGKKEN